jgi:glucoamylase
MWAHAEYLKLLRSTADGKVFDAIEPVFERYQRSAGRRSNLEVWSFQRRIRFAPAGTRIRIIAGAGFMLHWTSDEWTNSTDARSVSTGLGIHYVDIIADRAKGRLKFTFFWPDTDRWEGQDFQIELLPCEESHGDASGVRTYREQIAPRDSDAKGRQQRCEAVETSR